MYVLYFVVDTGLNINIWKFSFICCTFWCQKHNQDNWLRMFPPYLYFILANVISELTTKWGSALENCFLGTLLPLILIIFIPSHPRQALKLCHIVQRPAPLPPPFREPDLLCLKAHQCSDKSDAFDGFGASSLFIARSRGCIALNGVHKEAGTWSGWPSEIWLWNWLASQSLASRFCLFTTTVLPFCWSAAFIAPLYPRACKSIFCT